LTLRKTYTKKLHPDKNIIQRWQKSEVLLIGGSAGSFRLIFQVIRNFKADLNKTVIIIIHRKKNFFSEVEKLFAENSRISFSEISDKEVVKQNTIYIAPANYHTLIEKEGCFSLDVSDSVWYSKPSIDVTFESAAEVYKDRCTAILFSGANQDGAEGLLKLRNYGSLTIVQDPKEAEMPQMPDAAINIGAAEFILSTEAIFELLHTS
jgi:two-component system chemotaxis response regulator CheB